MWKAFDWNKTIPQDKLAKAIDDINAKIADNILDPVYEPYTDLFNKFNQFFTSLKEKSFYYDRDIYEPQYYGFKANVIRFFTLKVIKDLNKEDYSQWQQITKELLHELIGTAKDVEEKSIDKLRYIGTLEEIEVLRIAIFEPDRNITALEDIPKEHKRKDQNQDKVRPEHYKNKTGLEAAHIMEACLDTTFVFGGYFIQTVQYLLRLGKKDDPLQELKKAQWFLNRAIEVLEKAREKGITIEPSKDTLYTRKELLSILGTKNDE